MKIHSIAKAITNAVNLYITICCSEIGHKEPCQKGEDGIGSLGTWRCSKCRKLATVRVVPKNQAWRERLSKEQNVVA